MGRISNFAAYNILEKKPVTLEELAEVLGDVQSDVKAELERLESNYVMAIEGYDDKIKALEARVLALEKRLVNIDNPHSVRTLREDE